MDYNIGRPGDITWGRPVVRTWYNNNNIIQSICYYKVWYKRFSGYYINININININIKTNNTGSVNLNGKGKVNGVNVWQW